MEKPEKVALNMNISTQLKTLIETHIAEQNKLGKHPTKTQFVTEAIWEKLERAEKQP